MASTSDANSTMNDGVAAAANPDLENLFGQLDLKDEEFNDVEINKEDLVLLCPYDGFSTTKDVMVDHMPIWLQIHKLPDPYCKKEIVEKLLKGAGEILDMCLNGNIRGDYVRVRVNHDIQ
ncbi:hypothetical protein D1007_42359 [Hordeum vulgare]|nr:hypothetical protein D1007_42359 [Hordeum vulgare]